MLILVKILQRNITNSMRTCMCGVCVCKRKRERNLFQEREKREIYFLKELSHMIVDTSKSKTRRVGQQAREAGSVA